MGGGHLSRPDFGMPQPNPDHPLTEFYQLLQRGLDREGVFALPALYAAFQAPARRIYADEAADYLTLSETPAESRTLLLPHRLRGAAPAPLCLGGPAAAFTGLHRRADVDPHPAGCGSHRRRPRRAGPAALPGSGGQTLARPPQGRYLPRRADRVAPAIVQTLGFCYILFILPCNNWGISAVY